MGNMEEITKILKYYDIVEAELSDFASHSHDPDMWSYTFQVNGNRYVLVEVEAVGNDLQDDEYSRLQEDLGIARVNMKLVMPRLEQMQTVSNQAGIGIDGHKTITNVDDFKRYQDARKEAQDSRYFPPVMNEELPKDGPVERRNPNNLNTNTTWVLFKLG